MFLYAESPEQKRNTLSHLTEAFGLVFPNCTATFCSEDHWGDGEGGRVGYRKIKVVWGRTRGGQRGGKVSRAGGWSSIESDMIFLVVYFRGGEREEGGDSIVVQQEEAVLAGWKEKLTGEREGERREGRGQRRRSGREASGREKGTITQAWLLPQWGRRSCSFRQNMVAAHFKGATFRWYCKWSKPHLRWQLSSSPCSRPWG